MTFAMTRGAVPATPSATDVALEAGVTQDRAAAMIAASWHQAEVFTGRTYWPVTAATYVTETGADGAPGSLIVPWPREPAPDDLTVHKWQGGAWLIETEADYVPELGVVILLDPSTRYRFTQVGTLTPDAPGAHVVEAVRALALYQLIHSAARREFRSLTAGDSTLSREALGALFAASGAGILLAGEVCW